MGWGLGLGAGLELGWGWGGRGRGVLGLGRTHRGVRAEPQLDCTTVDAQHRAERCRHSDTFLARGGGRGGGECDGGGRGWQRLAAREPADLQQPDRFGEPRCGGGVEPGEGLA